MATEINFTKDGSKKEVASFTSQGPVVVQVLRDGKNYFTVYANLDGMEPVSIFSTTTLQNLIFEVDVPEGVIVTMESYSHVSSAKRQ